MSASVSWISFLGTALMSVTHRPAAAGIYHRSFAPLKSCWSCATNGALRIFRLWKYGFGNAKMWSRKPPQAESAMKSTGISDSPGNSIF